MVVRATTSTTATAPFNILDVYTGAAAAYSLRKLRGAYSGAAVRVRRSNDNAEQDIGFDANGNFNESALTSFVGVNSGFVTTWYDQSGNARHATQTTAANQPRIVLNGVVNKNGNRVSLFWDNTDDSLRVLPAALTVPQPVTAFSVVKLNNATTGNASVIFDANTTSQFALYNSGNTETPNFTAFLGAGNTITNGLVTNNQTSFYGLFNGANSRVSQNGQVGATGNAGANSLQGLSIGALRPLGAGAEASYFMDGNISEIILYASDQSAGRAAIESNIMSYFGIPRAGDTLSVNNNSDELATNGNGDTLGVA